jgi:flagellin-like hook-associated protein FlgL
MANSDVTISSGVANTLLSLQKTSSSIDSTQYKLSTGKKVNSAIDDPLAYFQARSLTNRATDLLGRKDQIEQGIKTVEAAVNGLEAIEETLTQMKALADQAKSSSNATEKESLRTQYGNLYSRLTDLADDAGYQGTNLIKSSADDLEVKFNEDGTNDMTISGLASSSNDLNLVNSANGDWNTANNIDSAINALDAAITTVRTNTRTLGSELSFLQIRSDFTSELVNTLETGAGQLVNADLNEESANMLALQTRQQLGTSALSIASQSEQAVLRLF